MSTEIEVKMRLADAGGLVARLQAEGASRVIRILEKNVFFDTRTSSLKSTDQGLRLRVERDLEGEGQTVLITHKGPRAHGLVKKRSEHELAVSDAQDAAALLTALGFVRVFSFEKRRERWALDGCRIELDELPHIGRYVEIEGPDEASVLAMRDRLGMAEEPLVRAGYISLLTTYKADHGIEGDHIGFCSE